MHAERNCLLSLETKTSGGTITPPPCVMAKWREGQIPRFNILGFVINNIETAFLYGRQEVSKGYYTPD